MAGCERQARWYRGGGRQPEGMPLIIVLVGGNGHDGCSGRDKGSGREDIAGAYMPPVWRTAVSIPVLPVNGSL